MPLRICANHMINNKKGKKEVNETSKSEINKEENGASDPSAQKSTQAGMFKETDYLPFMLGVFIIGGLIGMPLTYGLGTGLGYFESLPWALASCVVFLIAFRRNGTISWGRAIPAIAAIMIGATVYNQSTGKPAFAAGGILGFFLVMVCGYIGIGIGRILQRKG